jgi:hypothetical protein
LRGRGRVEVIRRGYVLYGVKPFGLNGNKRLIFPNTQSVIRGRMGSLDISLIEHKYFH